MNQLAEESASEGGPMLERLLQCKLSLKEKLETLKTLDEEIIALVEEDALEDQIEQADILRKEYNNHYSLQSGSLHKNRQVKPLYQCNK